MKVTCDNVKGKDVNFISTRLKTKLYVYEVGKCYILGDLEL